MKTKVYDHLNNLLIRYEPLLCLKDNVYDAFLLMRAAYMSNHKIIVAGNGGSAADAEHIVGELMKKFKIRRPLDVAFKEKLCEFDYEIGTQLGEQLEKPLRAISLTSHIALSTAYLNDVDGQGIFAQQLLGLGDSDDIFLAISTSGNSRNIINAAIVAKALGLKVVGLTGASGGRLGKFCDVLINVPETETYKVQEYHLPVYHCLCMMLEDYFFGE